MIKSYKVTTLISKQLRTAIRPPHPPLTPDEDSDAKPSQETSKGITRIYIILSLVPPFGRLRPSAHPPRRPPCPCTFRTQPCCCCSHLHKCAIEYLRRHFHESTVARRRCVWLYPRRIPMEVLGNRIPQFVFMSNACAW